MAVKNPYDRQHLGNLNAYLKQVDELYNAVCDEAARMGATLDISGSKPLDLSKYPFISSRLETLLKSLQNGLQTLVADGVTTEWQLANDKNDQLVYSVFGDKVLGLTEEKFRQYFSTNGKALEAFRERKKNGLNLSDEVWNYTRQFKNEIEMALDVGIKDGRSADQLSRDLRGYLKYPDKLFRRYKDKEGMFHLSKRAKEFHPGAGVYRSSYKNARRLAATETNIAYHTSDYERWLQLDFVVGIEVKLSNNHTVKDRKGKSVPLHDMCDDLAGRYPKTFKFTGWHPHCRCYAVSILKTEEEREQDRQRILQGKKPIDYKKSKNYVSQLPVGMQDWLKANEGRITEATARGTLPYFIKDNQKMVTAVLNPTPTIQERAAARHAARTEQQVADIKKRAAERQERLKIEALQPQITVIRKMCAEWNLSTYILDEALKKNNAAAVNRAISELAIRYDAAQNDSAAYLKEAASVIKDAKKLGIDVANVQKDLDRLKNDIHTWINHKFETTKHLNELKDNTYGKLWQASEILEKAGVSELEVRKLKEQLSEEQIIKKLGGLDKTEGSCASLSLAYAGNKCGFDVRDYRGGVSCDTFANINTLEKIAACVGGILEYVPNDFPNADKVLANVVEGKEYLLGLGEHVAVVRKVNGELQFLELQKKYKENGFKKLDYIQLLTRFDYGSHYKEVLSIELIDIELLKNDRGFKKLLGYLNTKASGQMKGNGGSVK